LPAFSAGISRFLAGEFMRHPLAMSGHSALSGDLTLFTPVHRREPAGLISAFRHFALPFKEPQPIEVQCVCHRTLP
jgi:hypothetical protein